jgi:hypothetical protein
MRILSRRSFAQGGREGAGVITTRHSLRTNSWTADVAVMETAVGRLTIDQPLADDCQVVFFEIPGDQQLHVNVIHQRPAMAVRGWAGPARVPEGFVHNQRFGDTTPRRMIRHIRDMVFAPTIEVN